MFSLFVFFFFYFQPSASGDAHLALLGISLFLFTINVAVCLLSISEVAIFNGLPFSWVFGKSLMFFFLGAAAGSLLFGFFYQSLSSQDRIILCGLCLFAILVLSTFVFKDHSMEAGVAEGNLVQVAVDDQAQPAEPENDIWAQKEAYICEIYHLTARQREVFAMLAKGRNASYIADEFCISHSTAKAHIRNIYAKVYVHSQQELISLVENAPL